MDAIDSSEVLVVLVILVIFIMKILVTHKVAANGLLGVTIEQRKLFQWIFA